MANRYAVAAGLWSAPGTWDGGASIPASTDDVYTNNFIVTVDQSITVNTLRNIAGTGIANGGHFLVSTAAGQVITITAHIAATTHVYAVSSSQLIRFTATTGSVTINSNIVGGNSSLRVPVRFAEGANCSLTINGNLTGGTTSSAICVNITGGAVVKASPTLTVNGTLTGGSNTDAAAIQFFNSDSTVVITGNVAAGSASNAIALSIGAGGIGSSVDITINGDVTGSTFGFSSSGASAISCGSNTGAPKFTVNGDIVGGFNSNSHGIRYTTGVLRVSGDLVYGSTGCAPVLAGVATASPTTTSEPPMLIRSGTTRVVLPSDDDWPLATGADITLEAGGGGGGSVPTTGQTWPRSS